MYSSDSESQITLLGRDIEANGAPSAITRDSLIGVWQGASNFGETGISALTGTLAFSVFEIPSIPDLSSPRFADFSKLDKNGRIAQMGERMNKFLASLSDLGPFCAVSLRYFFQPQANNDGKIRLFLIGRSFGQTQARAEEGIKNFRDTVQRTFPHEYGFIDYQNLDANSEVFRKALNLENVQSVAELLKPEQLLPTWHEPQHIGFSQYYAPKFFEAAPNDMIDFCRALMRETGGREAIVDICLVPACPLTEVERLELNKWKSVCEQLGRGFEREISGGLYSEPQKIKFDADPHAQEIRKDYEKLIERYGNAQNKYFLYAVRAFWQHYEPPREILNSLASFALSAQNAPQISSIYSSYPHFSRAVNAARFCYISPSVCRQDIWESEERLETIRRLHRLVDLKEISGFFRFPIAGREGCPGMETDTGFSIPAAKESKQIVLGKYKQKNQDATISLDELTKHSLIVGMPGSGKTTLCFSMLKQLWENYQIPFIVLEPAKTEYRGLKELPCFRDDLLTFTVGKESVSPFRFNPFEVPPKIELSEHLSTLKTCFSGAFNLFDPLPMMLDQAMREIYEEKGWSEMTFGGEDDLLKAPTLEDLYNCSLTIAENSSYKGEVAGNIKGALETRLGSLVRGVKGRCFNTRFSIPFDILMNKPVILELDALNDEEKALMMMFILSLVRAYAKTQSRERKGKLSHVVLVEEAHNVIGRGSERGASDKANPQAVSIHFFVNTLAELRAWGEGIVIADQLPTAIAPEAIKNTNTKIMHRVVSADDRQELGSAMVFDGGQFEQAATLPAGHSFIFKGGEPRSQMIVEPDFKKECEDAGFIIDPPPDDFQVKEEMQNFRAQENVRQVFLPYEMCNDVCQVCNPRVREQTEILIRRKLPVIQQKFIEERKRKKVEIEVVAYDQLFSEIDNDRIREGCAMVHFGEKLLKQLKPNK